MTNTPAIPDRIVEFRRMREERIAMETLEIPVLGHRCGKKHKTAEAWVRCAFPGNRRVTGKLGRIAVIMPCRLLSAVIADSRETAEAALGWTCCGPCDPTTHRLFLVTRKALPEGFTAGPVIEPGWDLTGGAW